MGLGPVAEANASATKGEENSSDNAVAVTAAAASIGCECAEAAVVEVEALKQVVDSPEWSSILAAAPRPFVETRAINAEVAAEISERICE